MLIAFAGPLDAAQTYFQELFRFHPASSHHIDVVIITAIDSFVTFFFHYRITHPVDSAFGLWLTSVICEIWFAFSWVLDQFPKWSPINRETFIDRLSARYTYITLI
jgi:hypothetical protein